jgi:hypothetical protein
VHFALLSSEIGNCVAFTGYLATSSALLRCRRAGMPSFPAISFTHTTPASANPLISLSAPQCNFQQTSRLRFLTDFFVCENTLSTAQCFFRFVEEIPPLISAVGRRSAGQHWRHMVSRGIRTQCQARAPMAAIATNGRRLPDDRRTAAFDAVPPRFVDRCELLLRPRLGCSQVFRCSTPRRNCGFGESTGGHV